MEGSPANMLAILLRTILALSLAFAPTMMARAMTGTAGEAEAHAMGRMADCPSAPAPAPDSRCAMYCMAGLPSLALMVIEPQDHGPDLTNFAIYPIGEGVTPPVATPPPR